MVESIDWNDGAEDTPAGPSIGERFKRYMAARRDAGLGHRDPDTPETARLAKLLADDTTPDATTCAHCRRDLTGASIHTIQGIDVCADIRVCLARQSRFVDRIAELDQAKAQHQAAQDERDGDVRAVAALLDEYRGGGTIAECKREFNALAARFVDRIAALEARDAKAGEQR